MRIGTGFWLGSCLSLAVLTVTASADASLDRAGANAEPARTLTQAKMITEAAYTENFATAAPRNLFHNQSVSEPDFASSAVLFKTHRNRNKSATNLKSGDIKILH